MILVFSPVVYLYLVIYLLTTFSLLLFNGFFLVWFVMELQIIIFVSLAFDFSVFSVSSVTIYFLFQSISSLGVFVCFFSTSLIEGSYSVISLLLLAFFLLNLGVFPFASWYVLSVESMSLVLTVLVLTFQKLPGYLLLISTNIVTWSVLNSFFLLVLIFNILYCSLMSFSSVSSILTFVWLSLAGSFWFILSLIFSTTLFFSYFIVYIVFVLMFFFSFGAKWYNIMNITSLMNMSGLPPLPDFFFKVFLVALFFDITCEYGFYISILLLALLFNVIYMLSYVNLIINLLLNELVDYLL